MTATANRIAARLASLTALRALVAGVAAFGLLAGSAGAQDGTGLVDDFAYESPTYGYELEWDRPWEAIEDETFSDEGVDVLSLETFGGFLNILGATTEVTPEEMVDLWVEDVPGDLIEEPEVVDRGADDEVAFARIEGGDADDRVVLYLEARLIEEIEDDQGTLLIVSYMFVSEETFDNSAAAAAEIELDGDPLYLALGADDAEEEDNDRRDREDEDEDEDTGERERDGEGASDDRDRDHDDDDDTDVEDDREDEEDDDDDEE